MSATYGYVDVYLYTGFTYPKMYYYTAGTYSSFTADGSSSSSAPSDGVEQSCSGGFIEHTNNSTGIDTIKTQVSTNTSNISTLTSTINSIKFDSILSSTISRTSTGSSTATLTTAGTSYDLLLCFVGYSKTEGKWVIVKPFSSQGSSTNFDIAAYSASYQAWGNIVWNYSSTTSLTFTLNEFGGWSTIGLWFVYGIKL